MMSVYWNYQSSPTIGPTAAIRVFVKVSDREFVILASALPFITSGSVVLIHRAKALLVLCGFANLQELPFNY